MTSTAPALTLTELLDRVGPVPAARVRQDPPPGTATEQDVIDIEAHENRLYELIDGVLLEKTMGYYESYLAALLVRLIGNFVAEHGLGIVAGADGMLKLLPEQVRIPDVSFVRWEQLPGRLLPAAAIPRLAPDLAIEVISSGNTRQEMDRKLQDYFQAGVRLVWYIYPNSRSVRVYTSPSDFTELTGDAVLGGGEVLPGFALVLADLFALPQEQHMGG